MATMLPLFSGTFQAPIVAATLHRGRPKHTNAPACVTLRRTAVTVSDTFDTVPVTTPPF